MKIKKLLSTILAITMIAGIMAIPQTSFAYDNAATDNSSSRAKLSYVYLGQSTAATNAKFPGFTVQNPEDLEVGKYVWVGVQVKNATKISDIMKPDKVGTAEGGIYIFSSAMVYDSRYLEPVTSTSNLFNAKLRNAYYPTAVVEKENEETGDMEYVSKNDLYYMPNLFEESLSTAGGAEDVALTDSGANLKKVLIAIGVNTDGDAYKALGENMPRLFQDKQIFDESGNVTGTEALTDDEMYIALFCFKIKEKPADGTKVLQARLSGDDFAFSTGADSTASYAWDKDRTVDPTLNIKNHFDLVDANGNPSNGVVDLFPAGAATKTGLTTGTSTNASDCSIATQYVGKSFDKTGLKFAYTYSDSTKKDVAEADITYKWATVNTITDKTDSQLQAMPTGNWASSDVTSSTAKKYLYAIAGDYIVCAGEMSVKEVVLSEITSVTSGITDNSVYENQTIDFSTLKTSIKYNDGTTKTNIASADLATYGLKIYKVGGTDVAPTYTEVTSSDKWVKGDNKFAVANADQTIKKEFTVKVAEDTLTVTKNTAPKTSYTAGNNFDPTAMKVNYKKASQASASVVAYADFTADLSVVIAKDETAAATAGTADATTTITQTMIDEQWHVYVVVNNGGTKSYVDMGQIGAKNINSVTVDNLSTTKTYGDALSSVIGTTTSITIKYDDNTTETIKAADFTTKGITYKAVKSADNSVLAGNTTDILKPSMTTAGAKIAFYKDGTLLNVTTNTALTVNKKAISYNFATTGVEKVYNGTTAIETGDTVDVTINKSDLVSADQTGVTGTTVAVKGLTFAYADKNVGDTKDITVTGTASVDAVTDFAANYTLSAANGAVADGKLVSVKGKITPATLNVTAIGNVPAINLDSTTLSGTNTIVLTKDNSNMVDGDAVTLTYTYTYSASTPVGTPTVAISNGSLTAGADMGNYTLGTVTATATGTITDINGIAVSTAPTKVSYEYNDTTLDLTGMEITVTNGDNTTTTLTLADFFANGGTVELTDADGNPQTITSTSDTVTLKSNATTTLTIKYKGKEATQNVTVKAQQTTGGGGGGGSMIGITLDKKAVSGNVGETVKVTATVKNTKKTPTWTSANESIATVDENGNITFVGVGETTIKVAVNGVYKTVNVVVTEEEVATPTPAPTEKPVINKEFSKPYAGGYEDGAFRPENNITRAELAAMIARLSYGDELPDGMYATSFPDVDGDAWFNKHIGYLENLNVLTGYEDGTFRPYDTITRGEIAAVIARAQKYDVIPTISTFADVTDADWAKDYIMTLANKGIVGGYGDGLYGTYSPLTRAEAVTIINRVLAPSTAVVTFTPNDIAGHWAEQSIMLAVNDREIATAITTPEVEETVEEEVKENIEEEIENVEEDAEVEDTTEADDDSTEE